MLSQLLTLLSLNQTGTPAPVPDIIMQLNPCTATHDSQYHLLPLDLSQTLTLFRYRMTLVGSLGQPADGLEERQH